MWFRVVCGYVPEFQWDPVLTFSLQLVVESEFLSLLSERFAYHSGRAI
jgi:hypothetical protein